MKTNSPAPDYSATSPENTKVLKPLKPQSKLVASPAQAEREKSKLKKFREESESEPTPGDTNARSSVAGQG
jgi:hypothetical protein